MERREIRLARLSLLLVIIGAINWLLVGVFQFDFIAAIFGGQDTMGARMVYTLIGIAAILVLIFVLMRLFFRKTKH